MAVCTSSLCSGAPSYIMAKRCWSLVLTHAGRRTTMSSERAHCGRWLSPPAESLPGEAEVAKGRVAMGRREGPWCAHSQSTRIQPMWPEARRLGRWLNLDVRSSTPATHGSTVKYLPVSHLDGDLDVGQKKAGWISWHEGWRRWLQLGVIQMELLESHWRRRRLPDRVRVSFVDGNSVYLAADVSVQSSSVGRRLRTACSCGWSCGNARATSRPRGCAGPCAWRWSAHAFTASSNSVRQNISRVCSTMPPKSTYSEKRDRNVSIVTAADRMNMSTDC